MITDVRHIEMITDVRHIKMITDVRHIEMNNDVRHIEMITGYLPLLLGYLPNQPFSSFSDKD
jgi:hypothetical protein